MPTIHSDEHTFKKDVTFGANVTFSETPPEISLSNLTNLSMTGDLSVGDDAAITGDLSVGGATTCAGTVQGADLTATDDLTVGDDASVGGDLAVTGTASCGGLSVSGAVDFAFASVAFADGLKLVSTYSSQNVEVGDLSAGATQSINLSGTPTNCIPLGCYVTTANGGAVGSSTGDTTGLSAEVGIASDPDLLLQSISVFGAASIKQGLPGVGVGGMRTSDTWQLKLTATGGAPDLADITNMIVQVHVFYMAVV